MKVRYRASWSIVLALAMAGCGGAGDGISNELQEHGTEAAARLAQAQTPAAALEIMGKYWINQQETLKKLKGMSKEQIEKIAEKLERAFMEAQEKVDKAIWEFQEKQNVAQANPVVVMETSLGTVKMELFEGLAPITVKSFLQYVDDKFYDGTIFHRVIPTFMIQGGGFQPGLTEKKTRNSIKNESVNGLTNRRGTMAMARTAIPDSASAQFFINVKNNDVLDKARAQDGVGYAVFGRVVEGMDVVDNIRKVPTGTRADHEDVPKEDVIIKSIRRVEKK